MSSPLEKFLGRESISSKLKTINFETPDAGSANPGTPDLSSAQEILRRNATPKTVAPRVRGVHRVREKVAKAKQDARLLRSVDSNSSVGNSTLGSGDTSMRDIVLRLHRSAEDMSSSEIRGGSRGLLEEPIKDEDIFTVSPVQGSNLGWMKKGFSKKELQSEETGVQRTPTGFLNIDLDVEDDTPTKNPKGKNPPKQLGIPFPNFGRFWGSKYNWDEARCNALVQTFAQCDPEDTDQVKELYDLAWRIKVSTAMLQCDTADQARVQQFVSWAQDFKNKNDWQSPVPLGWNLKQQQYGGPLPSDEERQEFVDYTWQMIQNRPCEAWEPEKQRQYTEAAAVALAFQAKYPDFPRDYLLRHVDEYPLSQNNKLEFAYKDSKRNKRVLGEGMGKEKDVAELARTHKRKFTKSTATEAVTQELERKNKKAKTITKKVDLKRNSGINDSGKNLTRLGHSIEKSTAKKGTTKRRR